MDFGRTFGLIAQVGDEVVAVARYEVNPATRKGEVVLGVHEDWRRRGVAGALMARLKSIALSRGLVGFWMSVPEDDQAALRVLTRLGMRVKSEIVGDCQHHSARFIPRKPRQLHDT